MNWLAFIFSILIIYNVTQIITETKIFKPIREFIPWAPIKYLLSCFLCMSVWVAGLISYLLYPISSVVWVLPMWQHVILSALIYSCVTWFLSLIEHKLSS